MHICMMIIHVWLKDVWNSVADILTNTVKVDDGHDDDVIKWKHLPRYWPFVREIHRSPAMSQHKGQWRGALMFSLICAWINGWVKQSWGWRFETPSCPLWSHCNVKTQPPHNHHPQGEFCFTQSYKKSMATGNRSHPTLIANIYSMIYHIEKCRRELYFGMWFLICWFWRSTSQRFYSPAQAGWRKTRNAATGTCISYTVSCFWHILSRIRIPISEIVTLLHEGFFDDYRIVSLFITSLNPAYV